MTKRAFIPLALTALALVSSGAAHAQVAVKMEGSCEKLVIADLDITTSCKDKLSNSVERNRTSFDFSAWDGQSLSFSGSGAQQEATELTEPLQPINFIVSSQTNKEGIVRNPAPAVGACRFSKPENGKITITCEATSLGKAYAGIFVTEAKSAEGTEKPVDAAPKP